MLKVVTAEDMRSIEDACVRRGISLDTLMQQAGRALAAEVAARSQGGTILVLVGPGNNGGDGLVAAQQLAQDGKSVTVYSFRRADDVPPGTRLVRAESDESRSQLRQLVLESTVVLDALLGIGATRPPSGELAEILRSVNDHRPEGGSRLAADIATGVDSNTGAAPTEAFHADVTLAMGFAKAGSVQYPGAEYSGEVQVLDIGIPSDLNGSVSTEVPSDADIANLLPTRGPISNKGSNGRVLFVGGSRDYCGAPAMSSLAAYRAGAGLVEVAVPETARQSVASHVVEAIFSSLPETDGRINHDALQTLAHLVERAKSVVFGPGMGLSDGTITVARSFLQELSRVSVPTVIDADALNALAAIPRWWETPVPAVLTPHPGEMSRLTGVSVDDIQRDRLQIARQHAREWNKVVVLKGAATVIASPDGRASINPTGSSNLATAGTGDILSGIIGGLLAQGLAPYHAALCGVYLHGRTGDLLRDKQGNIGMVAGDLLDEIPLARLSILRGRGTSI